MGSNASHAVLSGFDATEDDVLNLAELEDAELQAHWHALSTPAIGLAPRPQDSLAADPATRRPRSRARSRDASPWRGLARFWTLLLVTAATGAALLQVLGPPGPTADVPLQAHANAGPPAVSPTVPYSVPSTVPPAVPAASASAERPAVPEAPRPDKPPEAAAAPPAVPAVHVTEDRTQAPLPAGNPVGNAADNPVGNPVSNPADKRPAEPVPPPPSAREAKPTTPEPSARTIPATPPATDTATRDVRAAIAAITAPKPRAEVAKPPSNPDSTARADLSVHYLAGSDAEARRLAAQLGSVFEHRAIHSEEEVPRVAIVRFFQASDHATARTVGKTLADMGYTWRIENQSNAPTGLPGTIEVWLPSR